MKISIVYIIYQIQISHDLLYVLKNAMAQTAAPQIIICEQNSTVTEWLRKFCEENQITYVYLPEPQQDCLKSNMGLLKNIGIKKVKTDYIYFSDTDIIFLQQNYLENLMNYMEASGQPILVRPPMLRLFEGKEMLFKRFGDQGCVDLPIDNPQRRCSVRFDGEMIVDCGKENYRFLHNLPHFSSENHPDQWQLPYHSGGIFVNRSILQEVGGYGMEYFGWGLDDIDLQWKLNETYGARAVSDCVSGASVMHFEHPSRYNDSLYQKNRSVFEYRRKLGTKTVIEKDVIKFEQLS